MAREKMLGAVIGIILVIAVIITLILFSSHSFSKVRDKTGVVEDTTKIFRDVFAHDEDRIFTQEEQEVVASFEDMRTAMREAYLENDNNCYNFIILPAIPEDYTIKFFSFDDPQAIEESEVIKGGAVVYKGKINDDPTHGTYSSFGIPFIPCIAEKSQSGKEPEIKEYRDIAIKDSKIYIRDNDKWAPLGELASSPLLFYKDSENRVCIVRDAFSFQNIVNDRYHKCSEILKDFYGKSGYLKPGDQLNFANAAFEKGDYLTAKEFYDFLFQMDKSGQFKLSQNDKDLISKRLPTLYYNLGVYGTAFELYNSEAGIGDSLKRLLSRHNKPKDWETKYKEEYYNNQKTSEYMFGLKQILNYASRSPEFKEAVIEVRPSNIVNIFKISGNKPNACKKDEACACIEETASGNCVSFGALDVDFKALPGALQQNENLILEKGRVYRIALKKTDTRLEIELR